MSFDALTLLGISSSVLCGGFLIALVNRNESKRARPAPKRASEVERAVDMRP